MEAKEDMITFCQSELPNTSFATIEVFRRRGQFCDLTIKVQNKSIVAHHMILAAGIPYFQTVLAANDVAAEQKEIAVEEDLDPDALESLIDFAYTNRVDISAANAKSLLVASHFLQLNKVSDACVEFLSKTLRVNNVFSIRKLACNLANSKLLARCDLFILENFEQFSTNVNFLSLSDLYLKEMLSKDDLNVSSEEIVFEALMRWIKNKPSERHVALVEHLREVRLTYLPVPYLMKQVDTEELIASSKPCRELVNEAKYYHLLPNKPEAFPTLNTRPRNHYKLELLYGICSCDNCGITVQRFDVTKEKWQFFAFNKTNCGVIDNAAALNGKIYVFHQEKVQTFCLKSLKWEAFNYLNTSVKEAVASTYFFGSAALLHNAAGAAVVSYGNKIYCFGFNGAGLKNAVCCFNTQSNGWMETGRMNAFRQHHSAVSLGEYIYVCGGMDEQRRTRNTVAKYAPLTGKWSDIAPMLTPRYNHGSTSMNGKVFVCGGYFVDPGKIAEVYDPLTNQWNFISPPLNKSKLGYRLLSYCSKIYGFGESDGHAEIYDPGCDEWKGYISLSGGFKFALSIPVSSVRNDSD